MRNQLTLTLFSIMLESFVRRQGGGENQTIKIVVMITIIKSHTHHNNLPHKNWKSKIINVTYEKYENMFLKYVFLPGRSVKLYLYSSVHSSTQPRYNQNELFKIRIAPTKWLDPKGKVYVMSKFKNVLPFFNSKKFTNFNRKIRKMNNVVLC